MLNFILKERNIMIFYWVKKLPDYSFSLFSFINNNFISNITFDIKYKKKEFIGHRPQ